MIRINTPSFASILQKQLSVFSKGKTTPPSIIEEQLHGIMLASAYATNNRVYASKIENYARDHVDISTIDSAKSAAALIAEKCQLKGFKSLDRECIKDDVDFQLYLLAASYIADIDQNLDIRTYLLEETSVSMDVVDSVKHIASTMQSIAEMFDPGTTRKKKILVVDDEVRMTRILKIILERTGNYEVRTESVGFNVVSVARAFMPDLILLDIVMPDMSGEDVLAEIEKYEDLRHIKIVFLTGILTKEETGDSGIMIGDYFFLAKPVRGEELISCIDDRLVNLNAVGV